MKTANGKIIKLKQYREILQALKYIKEVKDRTIDSIYENYQDEKPKVLILSRK